MCVLIVVAEASWNPKDFVQSIDELLINLQSINDALRTFHYFVNLYFTFHRFIFLYFLTQLLFYKDFVLRNVEEKHSW